MSDTSDSETERWSRIRPFDRDGVRVRVQTYANYDYSGTTQVFISNSQSETFHADKYCHRLHAGETWTRDGKERFMIYAKPLQAVMTTWLDPVKPCSYCTRDIQTTAEIAVEQDGVPESSLKFFEPGDKRVTTTVRTTEDGDTVVSESASEVY